MGHEGYFFKEFPSTLDRTDHNWLSDPWPSFPFLVAHNRAETNGGAVQY